METRTLDLEEIGKVICTAKEAAKRYYELTGRPLGITGEVAEYEAARLLELDLEKVRQAGYDATRKDGSKVQIKGRRVLGGSQSGRLGSIKLDKEWDVVVLVLLDEDFDPIEIYQAQRPDITKALKEPGSKARNERGQLSISKFKSIAGKKPVWRRD